MDFFKSFTDLVFAKPKNAVSSRNVENCAFGDYMYRSKNAYLCYFCTDLEDCYYCDYSRLSRDCIDCSYIHNSELCYECTDCSNLYACLFLQDCHNCTNCYYSYDLLNCQDCFGCYGLRNQRFAVFNKVYPENEYHLKLKQFQTKSPKEIYEKITPEFDKHPRLSARLLKGEENCIGDYIYFSKNAYSSFNVRNVEDVGYVYDAGNSQAKTTDSYDIDFGSDLELCYECAQISASNNCNFLVNSALCSDSEYCVNCYGCHNCFGCVYLQNKEYHILNRPFSRDEYLQVVKMLKNELKNRKEYGKSMCEILS